MAIIQNHSTQVSTQEEPLIVQIIKKYSEGTTEEKDLLYSTANIDASSLRQTAKDLLKKALSECVPGDPNKSNYYPKKFEEICFDIVSLTFLSDFPNATPIREPKKNYTLYGRTLDLRDIVIENIPAIFEGNVWGVVSRIKKCQKIVFECKNYNKPIMAEEIYQLYGYLNPQTHGKFGVVLCRDKVATYQAQAKNAVKRVLIDEYVILVFDDTDIIEWLEYWATNGNVEGFFRGKYEKFGDDMSESIIELRKKNVKIS